MPKLCYIKKRFSQSSITVIDQANEIITEYVAQGLILTLRQLYYQFVSRDLISNNQKSYNRLNNIISNARLAGHIDWLHIIDRTRNVQGNSHWDSPADIIKGAAQSFKLDLWKGQPHRVEVWIEKDALVGVIEKICIDLDVKYFSCRGYTSLSAMWKAAQRFFEYKENGQEPVVIHLGDHDPSGIDMTRDILERIELLSSYPIEVERIALNMNQVEQYNPPPNPAKMTDTRVHGYIAEYGTDSWELDALEPQVMIELVNQKVRARMDYAAFKKMQEKQEKKREQLTLAADRWEDVVDHLYTEE
jgi:hypothetical protein